MLNTLYRVYINYTMGVRGLQSFLRKMTKSSQVRKIEDLLDPNNQRLKIGIDISFYIYKWQGDIEKIVSFIRMLQGNQHRVLLAFDGRAEDGKLWEAQRRRDARDQELKNATAILSLLESEIDTLTEDEKNILEKKASDHQKKGWSLTRDLRQALKQRLFEEKIPMVKAKGEADGLLAAASSCGHLDIILSGDMDLLAMGAKILWTPSENGYEFREYHRQTILEELDLSDWQFRSMCAICFTEASQEQNMFDIYQAYQSIRVFKSLTKLQYKYPDWLTVWPDDSHIFYRSIDQVEPWIRDDQMPIYTAFLECQPMPYT
jgi:hypothetical protein